MENIVGCLRNPVVWKESPLLSDQGRCPWLWLSRDLSQEAPQGLFHYTVSSHRRQRNTLICAGLYESLPAFLSARKQRNRKKDGVRIRSSTDETKSLEPRLSHHLPTEVCLHGRFASPCLRVLNSWSPIPRHRDVLNSMFRFQTLSGLSSNFTTG